MIKVLEINEMEAVQGGEWFGMGVATREDGSKFHYEPSVFGGGTTVTYEFEVSGKFSGEVGGTVSTGVKDGKVSVNSENQEFSFPRLSFERNVRSSEDVAKELWRIGEHANY